MIHEPAKWAGWQSTTAAAQHLDRLKQMQSQIYRILAERSGRPLRQIIRDTKRTDFYLDAAKAKEYGLIDEVLGPVEPSPRPTIARRSPKPPPLRTARLPSAPRRNALQLSQSPPTPQLREARTSPAANSPEPPAWHVGCEPSRRDVARGRAGTVRRGARAACTRELGCSRCRLQMRTRFRPCRHRCASQWRWPQSARCSSSIASFGAVIDDGSQFLLLATAVMASAWFAGTGPGARGDRGGRPRRRVAAGGRRGTCGPPGRTSRSSWCRVCC